MIRRRRRRKGKGKDRKKNEEELGKEKGRRRERMIISNRNVFLVNNQEMKTGGLCTYY